MQCCILPSLPSKIEHMAGKYYLLSAGINRDAFGNVTWLAPKLSFLQWRRPGTHFYFEAMARIASRQFPKVTEVVRLLSELITEGGLSVCLSVRPSVRSSVSPSVCQSVRLSVRPSVCSSVCLSLFLSVWKRLK